MDGHKAVLGGRGFSLGLSWKVLDTLSRVLVTVRGGRPGETAGFCPFKVLRGEQDPSFVEACNVIAAAASHSGETVKPEDVAKLRPGARDLNKALVEYAVALMVIFSPEEDRSPKASG